MFQGDFVKMVPEKWEPGQRAAVVKHKDNLVGFWGFWDCQTKFYPLCSGATGSC